LGKRFLIYTSMMFLPKNFIYTTSSIKQR